MGLKKGMTIVAAAAAFCGFAMTASAATVTATVDGTDNIYLNSCSSSSGSCSTTGGTAASAVSDGGTAVNFGGLGTLDVTASGSVVDRGPNFSSTSPDGVPSRPILHGLTRFALIGVWSSTSDVITAIGNSFFVGSSISLTAPLATTAYLFLGDNDGIFSDNSGSYSVRIDYEAASVSVVPLPAALPMLASAFGMIFLLGKRRRKAVG